MNLPAAECHARMLAIASGVAARAHIHGASPPAFNSTFYATVATVIPVLFLAIALQGNTFQALLEAYAARTRDYRARMRAAEASDQLTIRKALAPAVGVHLPGILASAIIVAGLYGEGAALAALYWQQAPGLGIPVFVAMLFLVAVASSGPAGLYQRMIRQDRAAREQEEREASAERAPEPQAEAGEQRMPAAPEPEPGKAGAEG